MDLATSIIISFLIVNTTVCAYLSFLVTRNLETLMQVFRRLVRDQEGLVLDMEDALKLKDESYRRSNNHDEW